MLNINASFCSLDPTYWDFLSNKEASLSFRCQAKYSSPASEIS